MSQEIPTSRKIFELLNQSPFSIYNTIFSVGRISIKRKISLAAACLNDQKMIDAGKDDPKDRNRVIKMIGRDLARLEAKIRIKELENVYNSKL